MLALVNPHFVNGDDVGMIEHAGGRRFGAEAKHEFFAGMRPSENHFDGDQPFQTFLAGLVHDAHATASDFVEQFVIAESSRESSTDR